MKHYELLALVSGNFSEEETRAAQQATREILEKYEGRVAKQELWEKRKLAYPVEHIRQGTYLLFTFDAEPDKMKPIDQALLLEKRVLRHQIVIAHQKTAKELEQEARHESSMREEARVATEKPIAAEPISKEQLDEKLEEILTDDMVK